MTILEQVKSFEAQGIYCVPVEAGGKRPLTKEGQWKDVVWLDEDFQKAEAFGIQHEKSNIIDLDFDDLSSINFQHLLPTNTLTIGKKVNGAIIPTHLFYRYEGNKHKYVTLEDRNKKDSVIVEMLVNTQTVAGGNNRVLINNAPPLKLSDSQYIELKKTVGKIALLTMLSKNYPKEGSRDEYCLIIAGCLVRYTSWTTSEREDFMRILCQANNDTEVKSRVSKITYQEEQYKLNKEVYGVKAFAEHIKRDVDICLNWFNWINNENLSEIIPINALSANEFIAKNYPQAEYLLYPLVAKETLTQVWAAPGVGKTLFSIELACALSNGQDFLKYKWVQNVKPVPVLYVEGEMSATQIQERLLNITERYRSENKTFDYEMIKFAILREQINYSFDPLNTDLGRKRLELLMEQMYNQFGQKPFVFLDNISCLTSFQEKDGAEWLSFMNWLVQLRSKGYTIFFLHHATKEGSTSSGSNMKERPVDLEIKLQEPEKEQKLDLKEETQMIVQFKKWREHNYTEHSQSFLASVARRTHKWSWYKLTNKKNASDKAFQYWKTAGIGIWSEDMKEHDEYPISKASFYRSKKKDMEQNEVVKLEEVPF
jgi:RecA-family ATPase